MSGQWWENDLIVGPFADLAAANTWAAANPSSLFPGLLATAGGVQYRWGGASVGWATVSPTLLGEELTLGTFGDSTCTFLMESVVGSVAPTAQAAAIVAVPASGTSYYSPNPAVSGLLWHGTGIRFIADGGIPGNDTAAMLARFSASPASNRRSLYDVAKINPRVLLLIGGLSINDLQLLADGSPVTSADAMIANAKKIIDYAAANFETVIYTTFLGFENPAFTASRNATIRNAMTYATTALLDFCKSYKNIQVVDTRGITCNQDYSWIPGMYSLDSVYLHLSTDGGSALGAAIKQVIDCLYIGKTKASLLYDFASVWFAPSSGMPANVTTSAYGSATGVSGNTSGGILSVSFTSPNDSSGANITISNLKTTALSGLVAGDSVFFEHRVEVVDSLGDLVDFYVETETQLTNGGTLRVGNVFGKVPSRVIGGSSISTHRTQLPIDAASLSASIAMLRIAPRKIGTFTARIYPPRALLGA